MSRPAASVFQGRIMLPPLRRSAARSPVRIGFRFHLVQTHVVVGDLLQMCRGDLAGEHDVVVRDVGLRSRAPCSSKTLLASWARAVYRIFAALAWVQLVLCVAAAFSCALSADMGSQLLPRAGNATGRRCFGRCRHCQSRSLAVAAAAGTGAAA